MFRVVQPFVGLGQLRRARRGSALLERASQHDRVHGRHGAAAGRDRSRPCDGAVRGALVGGVPALGLFPPRDQFLRDHGDRLALPCFADAGPTAAWLRAAGLQPLDPLHSTALALPAVIMVGLWKNVGFDDGDPACGAAGRAGQSQGGGGARWRLAVALLRPCSRCRRSAMRCSSPASSRSSLLAAGLRPGSM